MQEKFGILLIGNFLSGASGFHHFGVDLAAHLAEAGWPIYSASGKRGRLARVLDMLLAVWQRRRSYTIAYVEVYSGLAFYWAELVCWLLRRLHKPYVLTLHGGNLPYFAQRFPERTRRLLNSAHAVTTPSRYLQDKMQPYRANLQILPLALDLATYTFRERQNARPRLVWLRAFHAVYNPALAPQVVAQLVTEFPDIQLTMIGPDKGDGSAEQMWETAKSLGIAERITQLGPVAKSEIPARLNEFDIFLNTTNADNNPVSVIEAMACGLCVVSTNVGGLPYLLEHEDNALLAPPRNPEALAAAVRRLLTDPALSANLSHNARRKVEQWDWGKLLPRWEEVFAKLTTNGRAVAK